MLRRKAIRLGAAVISIHVVKLIIQHPICLSRICDDFGELDREIPRKSRTGQASGRDPNLFSNRANVVLYADVARLVAECARLTNCDDFCVRVGMRSDAAAMGLTRLVCLNAMKVGETLQVIAGGLKTSDTGGIFAFEARKRSAFLSYIGPGDAEPGNAARPQGVSPVLRRAGRIRRFRGVSCLRRGGADPGPLADGAHQRAGRCGLSPASAIVAFWLQPFKNASRVRRALPMTLCNLVI